MGKNRWRYFGIFVFGFFAFLELGDLFGMLSASRAGQANLNLLGISRQQGSLRPVILAILASGILPASLATAYALVRGVAWTRYSAGITAVLFYAYGAYQVFGGFVQLSSNPTAVLFTGIMYILLGVVANWIGQMARPTSRRAR